MLKSKKFVVTVSIVFLVLLFSGVITTVRAQLYVLAKHGILTYVSIPAEMNTGGDFSGDGYVHLKSFDEVEFAVKYVSPFKLMADDEYLLSKKEFELEQGLDEWKNTELAREIKNLGFTDVSYIPFRDYIENEEDSKGVLPKVYQNQEIKLDLMVEVNDKIKIEQRDKLERLLDIVKRERFIGDTKIGSIAMMKNDLKKNNHYRWNGLSNYLDFSEWEKMNSMVIFDALEERVEEDLTEEMLSYKQGDLGRQIVVSSMLSEKDKYKNIAEIVDENVFKGYTILCQKDYSKNDLNNEKDCSEKYLMLYEDIDGKDEDQIIYNNKSLVSKMVKNLKEVAISNFTRKEFLGVVVYHDGYYEGKQIDLINEKGNEKDIDYLMREIEILYNIQ